MNKTSTDKITSATPFLIWFRRCVPGNLQAHIRPYLDQPYRLALTVLDCCNSSQPLRVGEIAQTAGVTYSTAKQVLQALKEGGMSFMASPPRSWQPVEIAPLIPDLRTPGPDTHSAEALKMTRPYLPASIQYWAVDGFCAKQKFVDGVVGLDLALISKLRTDANLRYLYKGPQKPRGARRKYDGKVNLTDVSRWTAVRQLEPQLIL